MAVPYEPVTPLKNSVINICSPLPPATNDNGTTTVIRTVNVVVNQDSWLGDWSVSDNCGGGTGLALNGSPNIIAGGNGEQILITEFLSGVTGSYGTAICQIDGDDITQSAWSPIR